MGEIDDGAKSLRRGQRVKVKVGSHQPWGLSVKIVGHEDAGASIDYQDIAGPDRGMPRPDDFPIGTEFGAVIRGSLNTPERRSYYLVIPYDRPTGHPAETTDQKA